MTQKPENLPTHDVAGRFAAPIDQTAHEPAHWEKEAEAIRLLLADKKRQIFTTDESRRVQEALDAETYWKLPYYERWIHGFSSLLKEKGVLQEADLLTEEARLRAAGEDKDHRRPPKTMMPILKAPFYVMESWPIVNNTQGGPEHDAKQRVLDPMKQPIERLYVAGEVSSIYGHLYLEAGNIAECFVAGKIAGENVARERPWG